MTTSTETTCCETPEVWVVNSGRETVCHNCMTRTSTGHEPTVSVWDNQFR